MLIAALVLVLGCTSGDEVAGSSEVVQVLIAEVSFDNGVFFCVVPTLEEGEFRE